VTQRSKTVTTVGICAAVALILSYVESMLPPISAAAPGIRLGLANIVGVFLLYTMGLRCALGVSALRVAVSALLFGSPIMLIYSMTGALFSMVMMLLFRRLGCFSPVGVSVVGGVSHNLAQVAVAALLLDTAELWYYMAILTVTGTVAGVAVGLCAAFLIRRIPINKRTV